MIKCDDCGTQMKRKDKSTHKCLTYMMSLIEGLQKENMQIKMVFQEENMILKQQLDEMEVKMKKRDEVMLYVDINQKKKK